MTDKNWSSFEEQYGDLTSSLDAIEETLGNCCELRLGKRLEETLREVCCEVRNAQQYAGAIYSTCENDHCEDTGVDISQYEEVIEMLPTGNMSLGEVESLKEHIKQWRVENGYSLNS